MSQYLYAICIVLMFVAMAKCSSEQRNEEQRRMRFERIEYQNAAMEEAPQLLTIDASGRARYESHTNAGRPDHPEIGIYETVLPRERLESLSSALDNPPFGSLRDHWGQVLPSDHYRRIRVITRSETFEKLVGTRAPVDSNLSELIRRLNEIVAEVERHPRQTLRIELAEAGIGSTGQLSATLTFTNGGSQAVNFRSPANMTNANDAGLSVQLWPDRPSPELRAEDTLSAEVETTVPAQPSSEQSNQSVIVIPPSASISFRITAKLSRPRGGVYMVRALYETLTRTIDGTSVLIGEVVSRTVRANVP